MIGQAVAVAAGLALGWGLVTWIAKRRVAPAGAEAAAAAEQTRRRRGVEAVTWLIIVGVTIAGVLGAAVLYNTVLSDQGTRIQEQDIPCVYYDTGTDAMVSGNLNTAGDCTT